MQTLAVQIDDSYMQTFMNYVRLHSDSITIAREKTTKYEKTRDKNLEYDPYFYERKEEIRQTREDIKSGKCQLLSQEQYDKEMKIFFNELETNENNKNQAI